VEEDIILSDDQIDAISEDPTILSNNSIIYFGYRYFPHLLTVAPSDFHFELCDDIQNVIESEKEERFARAAPRGFGKTTFLNVIVPAWCICTKKKNYIFKIGSTASNAEKDIENLKIELEENEQLARDYPDACGIGSIWRAAEILTRNGVRVEAVGAGSKIRGKLSRGNRPDLVLIDDVENDENILTPDQRAKLLKWVDRAVMKLGSPKTAYVFIGTIIHLESMLNTVLKRAGYNSKKYKALSRLPMHMDLWEKWSQIFTNLADTARELHALEFFKANEAAMSEGVVPLWPERWSLYSLMMEYVNEGPYSFASERMNDPSEGDSLVTRDQIQWYNPSDVIIHNLVMVVGGVDPSMGKSKTSDTSAIIFVGIDESGYGYVLGTSIRIRHPDAIINDAFEMVRYRIPPWPYAMRVDTFLVEAVAFQSYFADVVDKKSVEAGIYLPVEKVTPKVNKWVRISGLQPAILNGWLKFKNDGSQETLVNQIVSYPHGKDDGPDALAMVWEHIVSKRRYGGGNMMWIPHDVGFDMHGLTGSTITLN